MFTTSAILTKKYDSPSKLVSFVLFQVQEKFSFQEGQFMMIEAKVNGKTIKKPYSIATTHQQLQEKWEIGFIVKKVSPDGMSDFLTQEISSQTQVTLTGPLGHYKDPWTHQNYLLVSAWSGLSPNLGIFQHLVYESKKFTKIVNVYGERYYKHIIPHVEDLFVNHGDSNVYSFIHLSKEEEYPHIPNPHNPHDETQTAWWTDNIYQPWHVQDSLATAIEILWTNTSCFLCGMPSMVDDVREKLQALWIPKENIVFEKY